MAKDIEEGVQDQGSRLRKPILLAAAGLLVTVVIVLAVALPLTLRKSSNNTSYSNVPTGTVKTYYIAAEAVQWDYAPSRTNLCFFKRGDAGSRLIRTNYTKAAYRQYTDDTFKVPVERGERQEHLGMLGPMIYAEEGDTVVIVFKNSLNFAVNMEPSQILAATAGPVAPGSTTTYTWVVPPAALGSMNVSSHMFFYRSTVEVALHTNAGLIGPLIVVKKGMLKDGKAADVDREFVIVMSVVEEYETPFAKGVPELANRVVNAINGWVYCNNQGLNASAGEKVRWHLASLGSEHIHTAHWHGITMLTPDGRRVDQHLLQPATVVTLDGLADNPGTWLLHCHVNEHFEAGMIGLFQINGQAPAIASGAGKVREYFLAAVQEEWDYTPLGGDMCSGSLTNFTEEGAAKFEASEERIGSKYIKARFVEFTDATYTTRKNHSAGWEHLGLTGPTLRAEVGDTIMVTLKNMLEGKNVTLHPHGVVYTKASEGSPYQDGSASKGDDYLMPGTSYTYEWHVPERAGPGPGDASTVMWMYHSHNDEIADTAAGLFGGIIVARKGAAKADATPTDVDRELVFMFHGIDEGASFLSSDNIKAYLPDVYNSQEKLYTLTRDVDFIDSNIKYSINGYSFCNMPAISVAQGEKVRIYLMGLGSNAGFHTVYTRSASLDLGKSRAQAYRLMPGSMGFVDMVPALPGQWLLECHVQSHQAAGMALMYSVSNRSKALEAASGKTRTYYIAAEEVQWDFAPQGKDVCSGANFTDDQKVFVENTQTTLGTSYTKAVYRQYSSGDFTQRVPAPAAQGILGPTLHAEPGDKLVVVLRNSLQFNTSLVVGGGLIPTDPASAELVLEPNSTYTYEWVVPAAAAPGPSDPSSVAYTYYPGVDTGAQINAGLMGALVVAAKGSLGSNDLPQGIDQEVTLLFHVSNENNSPYLEQNVAAVEQSIGAAVNTSAPEFEESNMMHGINGYVYCNIPQLSFARNSTVRWVILGFGSQEDIHSPVFTGQVLTQAGRPLFSPAIMPASTQVVDMVASSSGQWLYYCYVFDHMLAGMTGRMMVQ